MTYAIEVSNAGKRYPVYAHPLQRARAALRIGNPPRRDVWALRRVNLSIERGACFGIIGPNGAGKSTLLKLLTGISQPTEGRVAVNGSVSSILELGVGFHPDFSGRDNVFLNCALHGLTRDETASMLPGIIEFSELEDFIDLPVRVYSTGMTLRLGFSVATAVDPDILIVDEALAVGDEHFRLKCLNRMNEFKRRGKTVVLVSHDLATVRNFCGRVALLDRGTLTAQGTPGEILDRYLEMAHRDKIEGPKVESAAPRWGSGEILIERASVLGADGNETRLLETGGRAAVEIRFTVQRPVKGAVFGCQIYRCDGTYINGSNHHWHPNPQILDFEEPGETGAARCVYPALPLLPSEYYVTVCCYNHNLAFPQAIDHWERAVSFSVGDRAAGQHGAVAMDTEWELRRHANPRGL